MRFSLHWDAWRTSFGCFKPSCSLSMLAPDWSPNWSSNCHHTCFGTECGRQKKGMAWSFRPLTFKVSYSHRLGSAFKRFLVNSMVGKRNAIRASFAIGPIPPNWNLDQNHGMQRFSDGIHLVLVLAERTMVLFGPKSWHAMIQRSLFDKSYRIGISAEIMACTDLVMEFIWYLYWPREPWCYLGQNLGIQIFSEVFLPIKVALVVIIQVL